ncbi:hypothetical protein HDV01_001163 [Terramyces sp. JEL0728]|nr:hypothetical protein HDV01_001163 [Terramyces sp. JEL0728]
MPPASGKKGKKKEVDTPKEEPAVTKKVDLLNMPTVIRRNYLPRTYSGHNLLHSSNLTGVEGKIAKSIHTLIWHHPRELDEFPPLVPLEYDVEMKLLDIIMGDDPLNEATTVQDDQKKQAQLAESGLKEALWQAGKKRVTLLERHNSIIFAMQETLKKVAQEYNENFKNTLDAYLASWLAYAEYNNTTIKTIDIDLAKHSLQKYKTIKYVFEVRSAKMSDALIDLEKSLEDIENQRAKKLGSTLLNAADQLKKLNYQRHDAIDLILKEESVSINTILLNNRESIYECVYDFHKLLKVMNEKTQKRFQISDATWQKARWDFIYPVFESQVRQVYKLDIGQFYSDFNSRFRDNAQTGLNRLLAIMDRYDENNFSELYEIWIKNMDIGVTVQCHTIQDFLPKLNLIEKEIYACMAKLYGFWYAKLHEIYPESEADIIKFVNSMSKDEEIQTGKRASISLLSKAKTNRFIRGMVIEFVCCLSCTKRGFFEAQLIDIEIEVSKQLNDVSIHYDKIMETAEKTFQADLLALQNEFKESNIPKKVQKIKEHNQVLAESVHERFKKSIEIINSFMDRGENVFHLYQDILGKMFKEKTYNAADPNVKFLEHQFWQQKIHEWKQDQAAFIKQKSQNEADAKKRLHQVKVPARERAKSDGAAAAQRKDTLLDGAVAHQLPNALTLFDNYDFKDSSDMGYLANQSEDDAIVTIHVFDPEPIKKKRLELSKRIMLEANKLWEETKTKIQNKIETKTNQLVEARMQTMNNQLRKILATENAGTARIETVRNTLTDSLKNVLAIFKEFMNSTLKETNSRLASCKSTLQVQNLKREFSILVDMFQDDIKEELGSAIANFDLSKKMIGRSRAQGNHSSAWLLIKEQGDYDAATIIAVLDNWRNGMEDEMNKLHKDVANQIKQCRNDIECYEQDNIFLDFVHLNWRKIKNLMKGEAIKANYRKSNVTRSKQILQATETWTDILNMLESTRNIQREASQLAKYLCCAYALTNNADLEKPLVQLWDAWKERPHLNIYVQNQDIESVTTNPMFDGEIISRKNSTLEARGSESSRTFSRKNSKSSQSDLQRASVQISQQRDANASTVSREKQEKISFKGAGISTAKIIPKPNLPANKALFGICKVQTEQNGLNAIFKRWIDAAKKAVTEKYDIHIANNQIKKTDAIPSNMVEFVIMVDRTFIADFMQEANQFKESKIQEFHENVQRFSQGVEESILEVTNLIRINTIDRMAKIWKNGTNRFVAARQTCLDEKQKCEKELKLINTKYERIQEIERLDLLVAQISADLLQSYQALRDECSNEFQKALVDFLDRIQFLSVYASGIFDDFIDVSFKPGDPTSEWQVLEPLELTKTPFKEVVDRYSKFSIQCKKSADVHRRRFIEYRNLAVNEVTENILHHFIVLENHQQLQEETEKNYMGEWEEKSARTKRSYQ